jgi:Probable molybdopterin binding domain
MPKPKKPRRRKDTLLYMSALQMIEGLSLIEEQGEYLIKDKNIGYIAEYLSALGIDLTEVRVVGNEEGAIVDAINALRHRYTYVFTTGGIGPTHDDITSDCVAKAFGAPIDVDPRALAILHEWLKATGAEMSEARMRMTRIPARLLDRQCDRYGRRALDHAGNARRGGAQAQNRYPHALGNCPRQRARERYQIDAFSNISARRDEIEAYYPELHGPNLAGQFVNTSGGPVVADLITAPHVVVDLYPYAEEAELIRRYGVDLEFLLALRDRKLITIAANADVEAYQECPWMHDVLADERTVFRSVRTPFFFRSIYPDIVERREEWKLYLEHRFRGMTSTEVELFVAHTVHSQTPTAQSLARQLSWEWARIDALANKLTDDGSTQETTAEAYSIDDVLTRPDKWLPVLYRDFALIVSPYSGHWGERFESNAI